MGLSTSAISALAFALPSAPTEDFKPEAVWRQLRQFGYVVKPLDSTQNAMGQIRLRDQDVSISFGQARPAAERPAIAFTFGMRYRPKNPTSARLLLAVQNTLSLDVHMRLTLRIDGSLKVNGFSDEILELNQVGAAVASFESAFQGLLANIPIDPNPAPLPFDESQKVDHLDYDDAAFLAERWKWTYRGTIYGGSISSWNLPMEVDGVLIFIGRNIRLDGIVLVATGALPTGPESEKFLSDVSKKLKPFQVGLYATSNVSIAHEISMAGGITIRDLKKRIESFAKKVKPYVQ